MAIIVKNIIQATVISAVFLTSVAGCATKPDQIQGIYVSPATYSSWSCQAISAERKRVVNKVNELNGTQSKKSSNDAIAMGVGLVLLWPALFFLASESDLEPQIASLKGNYDALTSVGNQKGCFDA